MNKENTLKLLDAFPLVYPRISPLRRSPFETDKRYPFSFDCEDGWFELLWELSEKINKEIEQEPGADQWEPLAVQVKEKFGTLRFYCNKSTDGIQEAINEACNKSGSICELCGRPGERREGEWLTVRCDDHAAKLNLDDPIEAFWSYQIEMSTISSAYKMLKDGYREDEIKAGLDDFYKDSYTDKDQIKYYINRATKKIQRSPWIKLSCGLYMRYRRPEKAVVGGVVYCPRCLQNELIREVY